MCNYQYVNEGQETKLVLTFLVLKCISASILLDIIMSKTNHGLLQCTVCLSPGPSNGTGQTLSLLWKDILMSASPSETSLNWRGVTSLQYLNAASMAARV